MIKRFLLLAVLIILMGTVLTGRERVVNSDILSFSVGEELLYNIYYHWGFIWVNAGEVTFDVKEKVYLGKEVYHFDAFGRTHSRYDWLYRVRDSFQSYADRESLLPLWYMMDTSEGGHLMKDIYHFDHENGRVTVSTESSDKELKIDTLDIRPNSIDVITAVYHIRNFDFDSMGTGDSITLSVMIRDELMDLKPVFLGEEEVTTREGQVFNCYKFSVRLVEGFLFRPGDEMLVWVTKDDNRVPVLVEAQLKLGSVKVMLISAKGLRNPATLPAQ